VSPPAAPSSPSRRHLLRLVAGGALVARAARAQVRGELRVLLVGETAQHTALVQALRARWPALSTYSDPNAAARNRQAPLVYIAVGPRALRQALSGSLDAPLVSVLVSRQAYEQLIEESPRPVRGVTALFAEASPSQQMRTIAAAMRRRVAVGCLTSHQSRELEPTLVSAAQSAGLIAIVQRFDPGIGMSRNLLRLAAAEALLIFPDSNIFDPGTLRELLESTYRRRQPVFGFSEAMVEAGALASAFASASDLATHLVELLVALSERRLPAPDYPRYWRVAINDNVARSLDIEIDDRTRSLGDRP
jgi:putative tryptophan/tyrosine transport system substrate-binding protein